MYEDRRDRSWRVRNLPNSRGLGLNSSHGCGVAMWPCAAPRVQRRNSTEYSNAACFRVRARSERAFGPGLLRHGLGWPPATHSRSCTAAGSDRRRGAAAATAAATATAAAVARGPADRRPPRRRPYAASANCPLISRPSLLAVTCTVSPSFTDPSRISDASGFCRLRWITRFSGRAP
jgi:hypothetical protein